MPIAPEANDRTPDRVKDQPTWLIARAHATSFGTLIDAFESSGMRLRPFHYRMLAALDQWGAESQAALGRDTGIDPSDITTALAELEGRGLVARRVDPAHKRRNIVSITAEGVRALTTLDAVIEAAQTDLLAPLSAAERREFLRLLRRVVER